MQELRSRSRLGAAPAKALFGPILLIGAGPAGAVGDYLDQIPARPEACLTCHSDAADGELNPFGQDVEATLDRSTTVDAQVGWSALFNIDSDRDGQTNGQELGDPCGEWTGGVAPREYAVSHPGDQSDLTTFPETGCTTDERPFDDPDPRAYDPGIGGPVYTTSGQGGGALGGCGSPSCSQDPRPAPPVALLSLAAFLFWLRRRRG